MRPHGKYANLRYQLEDAEKKLVVYVAINRVNGNSYIGATKNKFGNRKLSHIESALKGTKGSPVFYAALRKHGPENFDWFILATVSSINELFEKEIELIAKLKPEYNITIGGQGVIGAPRTAEWRANMSKGLMGRKGCMYWLGKKQSLKHTANMRAAKKGIRPENSIKALHKYREAALDAAAKKCGYPIICVDDDMYFDCLGFASEYYGLGLTSQQRSNGHDKIRRGSPIEGKLFAYAGRLVE